VCTQTGARPGLRRHEEVVVVAVTGLETSLEKELKAWRESRSREHAAIAGQRQKSFPASSESRRVRVNGQEVLVVSRPRRPFS
jgi:hypothetical protein